MVDGKDFASFSELEDSEWLDKIKRTMEKGQWPSECVRCQTAENIGNKSIRQNSIDRHRLLHPMNNDYLILGGVLDNVCNSACQTCNAGLSTKIGSLSSKHYTRIDNFHRLRHLPLERVVELDINGGEPTASKNYKQLLSDLPTGIKIVRMNTNGSRILPEIEKVLEKDVSMLITISLDGLGDEHDYIRWPIKWKDVIRTIEYYKKLQEKYRNLQIDFWTTVSCLNVGSLPTIEKFAQQNAIPHAWAFLNKPNILNVKYKNRFTEKAKHISPMHVATGEDNSRQLDIFIKDQDLLRGIDIKDYFNF
jgi:MoaA/NifB/PqqE/SkfB family radical SAM enzyme